MNKLLLILPIISIQTIFAQTTMCFKENHNSLSTIENIKLEGGECDGKYTLKEMKERNWLISDIKITPKDSSYNFIYILKKPEIKQSQASVNELKNSVIEEIKNENKMKINKSKNEELNKDILEGKRIYQKCASCHGQKGEIEAYDTSEALNTLSEDDMKFAINRYTFSNDYGNGNEMIMKQYASNVNSQDIKKIYRYLKSINK